MSHRTDRVGAEIRKAVQTTLSKGLADPRVRGLITVTSVTVSDDLRSATVRVSVFPQEHGDLTMHGLHAAAKHIRHQISDKIALPKTPKLLFKLDRGVQKQAGVLEALAKARAERADEPDELNDAETTSQDDHTPATEETGK
ncbi:MAG: 30S ribosome-binding factor RbfA [Planctomycetota bacterium]